MTTDNKPSSPDALIVDPSCYPHNNYLEMGSGDAKSKSTVPTCCVESSEEFTLSAELSAGGTTEDVSVAVQPMLQLSGLSIVDEGTSKQRQQQQHQQPSANNNTGRLEPTAEGKGVHFAQDVTIIEEKDLVVVPPSEGTKKSRKKKLEEKDVPIDPDDIWWSAKDLEQIELNAMYMVKECQQYREEVVCTVLYNKAFLTAVYLAKTICEEELENQLQDVTLHAQTLESWTAVGQSRRGLENMVSEKAALDALQSRKAVLQVQDELRAACKSASGDAASITTLSQHAEFLAKQCQDSSRTARIMARMMGHSDWHSLAKAEEASQSVHSLPNPPGAFDNYDYHQQDDGSVGRVSRSDSNNSGTRRTSRGGRLLKPIKKALGGVFRRQSSQEVHKRRILRMQQKRMAEQADEPAKRPSQEFRRSFLARLDYGEQEK